MTELERQALLKELDELADWMRDSAPDFDVQEYKSLEEQIKSLEHESGDFYEVLIDIHLNNGRYITICNRAFESLMQDSYLGDDLFVERDNTGKQRLPLVYLLYEDPKTGFMQTKIPVSSICYVSGYTKEIKWQVRWDVLSEDKKKEAIAAFKKRYSDKHRSK